MLFLIRHGQASFGQKNYDQLSDLGYEQTRRLGEYLAKTDLHLDMVCTGTKERQIQTAKGVQEVFHQYGLPFPDIIQEASFDEFDAFKVWNDYLPPMLKEQPELRQVVDRIAEDDKAFEEVFSLILGYWLQGKYSRPDTPTWPAFKEQVRSGYKKLFSRVRQGNKIAIFTSGGPIAVTMQLALNLSDQDTLQLSKNILNASLSKFSLQGKKDLPGREMQTFTPDLRLLTFNQAAHLEYPAPSKKLLTYK